MNKEIFWYKIYDNVLSSEVEYPHLITTTDHTPQIFLKVVSIKHSIKDENVGFIDKITKERIFFHNQVGSFQITKGTTIEICPNSGIPLERLTPFVFGYCMAMLFWQRGMTAIHCSAVEYKGKALLVAGGSGSGKSTLTTRLIEHGFRLMTDDVAVLGTSDAGEILVYSAFPQQKLCRDALLRNLLDPQKCLYIDEDRDKFAVSRRDIFCETATPLAGIIFLKVHTTDEQVRLTELRGHEKLMSIIENQFLYPMFRESDAFSPKDMQMCLQIAQNIPMYRMHRPDGIDSTSEQMHHIMNTILLSEEEG